MFTLQMKTVVLYDTDTSLCDFCFYFYIKKSNFNPKDESLQNVSAWESRSRTSFQKSFSTLNEKHAND